MFTVRTALLLSLAALITGCAYVTNIQPQETRGGFSVLVDVPGQPASARVVADIDAFVRRRGFVHQGGQPGSEQYRLGEIKLDVIYQAANLRVNAYLHSFSHQLSRKFIDQFYTAFRQQYAGAYGEGETIFQTDYSEESGGVPRGGGDRRGGGGGGGGGR